MDRQDILEKRADTARTLLNKAYTDLEFAEQELRECGLDPARPLDEQLRELDDEAKLATERAEQLLEALDAVLDGS